MLFIDNSLEFCTHTHTTHINMGDRTHNDFILTYANAYTFGTIQVGRTVQAQQSKIMKTKSFSKTLQKSKRKREIVQKVFDKHRPKRAYICDRGESSTHIFFCLVYTCAVHGKTYIHPCKSFYTVLRQCQCKCSVSAACIQQFID